MSLQEALALHQQGQLAQAEASYLQLIQTSPDHHKAMQLLGVLYLQSRIFDQAHTWLGRSLLLNPDHAQGHCNMGSALEGLGRLDEAMASLDSAIALKRDYPLAWFNRGNVLHKLRRYALAAQSFEKACQGFVQSPQTLQRRPHVAVPLGVVGVEQQGTAEPSVGLVEDP